MVDTARLALTAQRLIEANGRSTTLIKRNRTASNSSQPWRGNTAAPNASGGGDSATAIGVFVPPGGSGFGSLKLIDGELSVQFEQMLLIAGPSVSGLDLREFDRVEDGDRSWRIADVQQLKPAGTNVIFALGLKS